MRMSAAADTFLQVEKVCVCAQLSLLAVGESLAPWMAFPGLWGVWRLSAAVA